MLSSTSINFELTKFDSIKDKFLKFTIGIEFELILEMVNIDFAILLNENYWKLKLVILRYLST
jgi:hypothetical protein